MDRRAEAFAGLLVVCELMVVGQSRGRNVSNGASAVAGCDSDTGLEGKTVFVAGRIWQAAGVKRLAQRQCALTIAGSDSGGGAGIQADLKAFAALGVHGTSVLTCVTAQHPGAVLGVHAVPPASVAQQLKAVSEGFAPGAVKTGMLFSSAIVERVAEWLGTIPGVPVVVDPVMVATSGARLLKPAAIRALTGRLLPLATLATPNVDEASVLTGVIIREPEDLRQAARVIHERFGCAALIKGGHLEGAEAIDVFWDGREEWLLSSPRVHGVSSHGTGCTYAAAIAGYLALGCRLFHAVEMGKTFVSQAIAQSVRVGPHAVLNPFWEA